VSLGDLFTKPADGLRALAAATRERMRSSNRCVRDLGYRGAFAPTRRRYRKYALTPGGVAVAFDLAEVASPPCGRVHTTVPYSVVEPYLNELGQELVAGVR
jgi:hypothetical protein